MFLRGGSGRAAAISGARVHSLVWRHCVRVKFVVGLTEPLPDLQIGRREACFGPRNGTASLRKPGKSYSFCGLSFPS